MHVFPNMTLKWKNILLIFPSSHFIYVYTHYVSRVVKERKEKIRFIRAAFLLLNGKRLKVTNATTNTTTATMMITFRGKKASKFDGVKERKWNKQKKKKLQLFFTDLHFFSSSNLSRVYESSLVSNFIYVSQFLSV